MPETIEGWYKQVMHLDRQLRRAKQEAEYYNKMMRTARTMQPQNNAGQYESKPVAPAVTAKDSNTMDVDKQHR